MRRNQKNPRQSLTLVMLVTIGGFGCMAVAIWSGSENYRRRIAISSSVGERFPDGQGRERSLIDLMTSSDPARRARGQELFGQMGWWVPDATPEQVVSSLQETRDHAASKGLSSESLDAMDCIIDQARGRLTGLVDDNGFVIEQHEPVDVELKLKIIPMDDGSSENSWTFEANPEYPPLRWPNGDMFKGIYIQTSLGSQGILFGEAPWTTRTKIPLRPGKCTIEVVVGGLYYARVPMETFEDGTTKPAELVVKLETAPEEIQKRWRDARADDEDVTIQPGEVPGAPATH